MLRLGVELQTGISGYLFLLAAIPKDGPAMFWNAARVCPYAGKAL
jgi:hypothetical protein